MDPHQITNITDLSNSKGLKPHKITDITDMADFIENDI